MGTLFTGLGVAAALSVTDIIPVHQGGARAVGLTGAQLLTLVGTTYVPLAGGTMTGALTIASGTLAASAPALNVTQTWNAPGVAMTAAVINVTNTASNGLGPLLDLQVGGTSVIRGRVDGTMVVTAAQDLNAQTGFTYGGFRVRSTNTYGFSSDGSYIGTLDVILARDAAATLAQRNGTNAQTLRIYGTADGSPGSNYQRMVLSANGTTGVTIAAEGLGTPGANQDITLTPGGTGSVKFPSGASVDSSGVVTGAAFVTASAGYFGGVVIGYPSSDAAFLRGSAGQIDVTNGTAATYRDLKLRNLLSTGYATIDSGTLTASAPALSITQTWNQGATSFIGMRLNITNTDSAASYPLVVTVSSSDVFFVSKSGDVTASYFKGNLDVGGQTDLLLVRDAAATLAQRNGTTQQIFRLYNTYTDASNYERLTLTGVAGTSVNITAETLGTGGDNLDIVLTPAGTGTIKTGSMEFDSDLYLNRGVYGVKNANYGFVAWTSGLASASVDVAFYRNAAGVVEVNNGTAGTWRDLKLRNLIQTEYSQLTEMTAPSAPAANSVRIYAVDNGAGKTQLMALFATGSAVQLGIEP